MSDSLAHRGPDGEGHWINGSANAGLSHRWLRIIDCNPAAAQPMHLERYSIVYNGEIYNYAELREELSRKGCVFKTGSDTEVLLAMYSRHKEKCLDYLDGMFAFAIWDEAEQQLFCARDRFGEKPFFYYYDEAGTFYFGSELKALYAAGIGKEINNALLLQFIAHGHTSSADPYETFDRRIRKLPAAHYCTFCFKKKQFSVSHYWRIDPAHRRSVGEDEAVTQFSMLLSTSVKRRLRSAVAVGTSLSGGLDSSSVASIISRVRPGTLKTFTASFPGFEKDEAMHAREVAEQCGFENYLMAPSAAELARDLSRLMFHQEEPFTSASVYAQYRVFGLAKENNTVVLLDGQGADETLAGYERYKSWRWRSLFPRNTSLLLRRREAGLLMKNEDINPEYIRAWAGRSLVEKPEVRSLNDMLYYSVFQSGLEELLRYADRNSMAHGREARLPFLSHELVSFVFSLPDEFKIRKGWTKWILRASVDNDLPNHIVWNKKKTGFEPPQKAWMENKEIQEYIRQAQTKLVEEKILNESVLRKRTQAHAAYDRKAAAWRQLIAYFYSVA